MKRLFKERGVLTQTALVKVERILVWASVDCYDGAAKATALSLALRNRHFCDIPTVKIGFPH